MLEESWLFDGARAGEINVGISNILMSFSATRQAVTAYKVRMVTRDGYKPVDQALGHSHTRVPRQEDEPAWTMMRQRPESYEGNLKDKGRGGFLKGGVIDNSSITWKTREMGTKNWWNIYMLI